MGALAQAAAPMMDRFLTGHRDLRDLLLRENVLPVPLVGAPDSREVVEPVCNHLAKLSNR